jgi:hypothetical protein
MSKNVLQLRSLLVASLLAASTFTVVSRPAVADLMVSLPNVIVPNDGLTHSFDVTLTVTGTAPLLTSYNLHFSVDSTDVTFGTPTNPVSMPLFSAPLTYVLNPQDVSGANDSGNDPGAVLAFDVAGLLTVPFTVPVGVTGVYMLSISGTDPFNQFANELNQVLPVTYANGSITVTSVPEAAGWKYMAAVAVFLLAGVGALKFRRRAA